MPEATDHVGTFCHRCRTAILASREDVKACRWICTGGCYLAWFRERFGTVGGGSPAVR